jgi:hypothetical protein
MLAFAAARLPLANVQSNVQYRLIAEARIGHHGLLYFKLNLPVDTHG